MTSSLVGSEMCIRDRLFASPCGIMPSDTDTWTLVCSKPFISSSKRANIWMPSSISLFKAAFVTPQPRMV
eukprot:3783960-Prorocentrum_lima.AAC.1